MAAPSPRIASNFADTGQDQNKEVHSLVAVAAVNVTVSSTWHVKVGGQPFPPAASISPLINPVGGEGEVSSTQLSEPQTSHILLPVELSSSPSHGFSEIAKVPRVLYRGKHLLITSIGSERH